MSKNLSLVRKEIVCQTRGEFLNYIAEYLKNPIKSGVYRSKLRIDFKSYDKFVDSVVECCESGHKTRVRGHLKLDNVFSFRGLLSKISYALNELWASDLCPDKIEDFYDKCEPGGREKESSYQEILGEEHPIELIEPLMLPDENDVLYVDVLSPPEDELRMSILADVKDLDTLVIEVISLKEKSVKTFLNFLKAIPYIGDEVQIVKTVQQTFSSRYSFQPYPIIVRFWLRKSGKTTIPKDLQDFIDRAAFYHIRKQWRTSIVLSAITVESLLADLYEESYQKRSPEKATLGELFELVKKKVDFPKVIAESIAKTNNARISGVHRSHRLTVSQREATDALFGAVNLGLWCMSDYSKKPDST